MHTSKINLWQMQTNWNEVGRIALLAFPLILSNLTQPLLASVDTVLAGHQNSPAVLGGVAMGGVFFNTIFWSFGFLRMATTGLVAQARGAKQTNEMALHVVRAAVLAVAFGLLILVLQAPLIHLVLMLLGGSAEVQAQAALYCKIRVWAAPASLLNFVVLGTLLGLQRSRLALGLQASIQLFNVVAALWLVGWLHWGIAGISTATLSAEVFGCLLGLALLAPILLPTTIARQQIFHTAQLRRLLRLNTDIFLRTLALVAAFGWFTRMGANAGDVVLAANAILLNLLSIASYALDGFANVTEALVGEAVGERNAAGLKSILHSAAVGAGLAALCIALAFLFCGSKIILIFSNQTAILHVVQQYLPWMIAMPLIAVWSYMLDGVFIGATRSHELRNAMLASFGFFLIASSLLSPLWANHGLWLAFLLFMAMRAATLATRLPALVASVRH